MKKLLILPLVLIFSFFTPLVSATPKVSPEKEADFMFALLQLWGESVPYSELLSKVNDPEIRKIVDVGYVFCDKLTELTADQEFTPSEIIEAMAKDEDQETREYAAISQLAVVNLCPDLK